jgi:transposase
MGIASVATASADTEISTIYVALELSKSRWLVGIHTPLADKVSRYAVPGGDSGALLDRLGRVREQAERRLERPVRSVCCHETGYDGFWLHRLLCANGIGNRVMDPASLPVNRRARRAKTDRIDLSALLRALMAWHRGEKQVCRMVRVPSPEQEERRRRSRERGRLIKERVQHIGRIKGLLMTQGIRDFQPARRDWSDRLERLRTGDGRELPQALKAEVERECRRLWQVIEMIGSVDRERDAARTADGPDQIDMLTSLVGVGDVSASILADEVFHRDFANRREVAG